MNPPSVTPFGALVTTNGQLRAMSGAAGDTRRRSVTPLTYGGGMTPTAIQLVLAALGSLALVAAATWGTVRFLRRESSLGSEAARQRYATLHAVARTVPTLERGLSAHTAPAAAAQLSALLGAQGVALLDTENLLAQCGRWPRDYSPSEGAPAERTKVFKVPDGARPAHVIVAPLRVGSRRVGTLQVAMGTADAAAVRAVDETAQWVSALLGVSELESSRTSLAEAQVRALRAQISPHFIYNALNAIGSFVLTDPARARELVLEFADFTRYSFRRSSDFTTLAEELTAIEAYLQLERARFGERLRVRLDVATETLPIPLPFLSLQPLVENAVRHGLERSPSGGTVTLSVRDDGDSALISVEDDGVGADPEQLREILAGASPRAHVGLRNVDQRLRQVYGESGGLIIDTAPGAGLKVMLRLPKFHPAAAAALTAQERA